MKMLNGDCMATSRSSTIVVCDAGPVLHLYELGCLELLSDFQRVILPETIVKEIIQHQIDALRQTIVYEKISGPFSSDLELLTLCRMFALHAGEIEALSLMKRFPEAFFLTDDSAARLVAQRMGYKVHGTIGILLRSIRRNIKTPQEVRNILQTLPQSSTLHIRPSLVENIIQQIEREFCL